MHRRYVSSPAGAEAYTDCVTFFKSNVKDIHEQWVRHENEIFVDYGDKLGIV